MTKLEDDDVVLKFLHTADWHLGRGFSAFSVEDRKRLSRARLEGIDRLLGVATQHSVHAILCAGDLFDTPDTDRCWWEPLVEKFQKHNRPIVLLPGNHDPLQTGSIYQCGHPFRKALPNWVHVVDRDDFELKLSPEAVLYATPCRSKAGQADPTDLLPKREPGDTRIRIGLVHGNTVDINGHQNNFPISADAATKCGLDYLAIGDHHGFRQVPPLNGPPTVYPGTHEPLSFGDREAGSVLVVCMTASRKAILSRQPIAHWSWEEATCYSLDELRYLSEAKDRKKSVLRLKLEIRATASDYEAIEEIIKVLEGTDAIIGRVGILQVDRSKLELDTANLKEALDDLPGVLKATVDKLQALERGEQAAVARQALLHLYRCVKGGK